MLWWKLSLTPLIIGALTLVGRRWGPRAAGLIAGLPLTTGPVSVFLANERGTAFATHSATGAEVGLMNASLFVAAFAYVAKRKTWPVALASALAALVAPTFALNLVPFTLSAAAVMSAVAMILMWAGVRALSGGDIEPATKSSAPTAAPVWDIPMRMVVATAMVAGVTAAAGILGPSLSGALSALPVIGGLLAIFTLHHEGRSAMNSLVAAIVIGSIPTVLFFAVVGVVLERGSLASTYGLATALAALSGLAITWLTRPIDDQRTSITNEPSLAQRAA